MLESLTGAMARIEDIKSHFRSSRTQGPATIAPHYESGPLTSGSQVKPYFPDYLVQPVKEKVMGSVESVSSYDGIINSAAAKWGVDPALIKGVIKAESGFNANAVSRSGAQGLMQLMPGTARSLGVNAPFDPEQNINGGVRYLRGLLDRFGGDETKAVAAYNAGPGRVMQYDGVPPFTETQNYVSKVLEYRDRFASE